VLVTELTHSGEVAVRGHEDPVRADDRLEDDRRDGAGSLHHDGVAQMLQPPLALLLLGGGVERGAVGVGTPVPDDTRHTGL